MGAVGGTRQWLEKGGITETGGYFTPEVKEIRPIGVPAYQASSKTWNIIESYFLLKIAGIERV